eukprot:TRINITY_DN24655_c0_g1_i3.p1 TRINITY_DN24655_c0_g1~~TRINITY_DN24655_c0_g1_i3.p1  ORF type:complete len:240 (-),score=57.65 TRINITY_DN24655_c0_g1_i3:74-793(-)
MNFQCCCSRKQVKTFVAGGRETLERRKALAALFDLLDADLSGTLCNAELLKFMNVIKEDPKAWSPSHQEFLNALKRSESGSVERTEFMDYYDERLEADIDDFRKEMKILLSHAKASDEKIPPAEKEKVERRRKIGLVFDALDADAGGSLSISELKPISKSGDGKEKAGSKQKQQEEARLLKEMDKGGDGVVQRGEFIDHYDAALPKEKKEFDARVAELKRRAEAADDVPASCSTWASSR